MQNDARNLAVQIETMRKTYKGKVQALRGASLSVSRGSCYGLLGANGAGKSTLIKGILTILRPNEYQGQILGEPAGARSVFSKIGYLPENPDFAPYLTGAQVIDYSAGLAGVPMAKAQQRRDELLDLVGMRDWATKKIKTYSKGMRQRIGLAQALVNQPELVFLDEPTDGVDPSGRRDIRAIIASMQERGVTVFLNSHLLGEVEQMCDRVCILAKGEILLEGELEELVQAEPGWEVEVLSAPSQGVKQTLQQDFQVRFEGERNLIVPSKNPENLQLVIDFLRANGGTLVHISQVRLSLEAVYLKTTGHQTPGAAQNTGQQHSTPALPSSSSNSSSAPPSLPR